MMKKRYSIIIFLLIFTIYINPLWARGRKSNIGIIDYSIVEVVHPLKKFFLYEPNIYLKPSNNFAKIYELSSERDKELSKKLEISKKKIEKIEHRIFLISKRIRMIDDEIYEKDKTLKEKFREVYSMKDGIERDKKLNKIRKKIRLLKEQTGYKKATYEVQLENCKNKIFTIKSNIFSINYLNENETIKLERTIKSDIDEAIKKVAVHNRIGAVINISALKKKRARNWKFIVEKFWKSPSSKWQNFYFIFREYSDFKNNKIPDSIADDYKFKLLSKIKEDNSIKYEKLDNLIPYGGIDITTLVVDRILKKYNYPYLKRKLVKEAINEYKMVGDKK